MLGGGLGWPQNGFPEAVQKVVLGEKRFKEAQAAFKAGRAGNRAEPVHLDKLRRELSDKLRREATEDDLYSHLMYPAVFAEFAKHLSQYSDVSVLPTPAFFYGLRRGEEIPWWEATSTTAHQAVGALLIACTMSLVVLAWRATDGVDVSRPA